MIMDEDAITLVRKLAAVASQVIEPEALIRRRSGPDGTIRVPGGWIKLEVADAARSAVETAEAAIAEVASRDARDDAAANPESAGDPTKF